MAKFNLLDTLKGISEGVLNSMFLDEQVEEIAKERLSICSTCPFNSEVARATGEDIFRKDNHCLDCGCNLTLKTRAMSQHCPKDKWLAVTNTEIGNQIDNILKEKKQNENK